jgi:predicted NBD/HSP70 family sugar kinase
MQISGDQQLLKEINRMALVCHLCSHPGLSRADLAEVLGLTKSTVSLLTRELIQEGWMVERDMVATGNLGRRPTPLYINPDRLVLVGADLNLNNIRIVATTLTGEILHSEVMAYDDVSDPQRCIHALANGLIVVGQHVSDLGREISGLGVGLPGGVDEANGFLHFAPNLGWRGIKVGQILSEQLRDSCLENVPLFFQNDADVAVLGELEFSDQTGLDPLVYVSLNQGVGAGVVVNDRLLTGMNGFAGEIGHSILEIDGPLCSCGRRGCAEAVMGLRHLIARSPFLADQGEAVDFSDSTIQLSSENSALAKSANKAGRYLGALLQNLWVAYDPVRIVIGGSALRLGRHLLDPALDTFKAYASAAQLTPPQIQRSRFGEDAVAVGAAALVRYRLTRPLLSQVKQS